MNGLLLVDKPRGITSFDVIRRLRPISGVRKIGHAGTLDPLASGLMLILFGSACKKAQDLTKADKCYEAMLKLGFTSTTGDGEGDLTEISDRQPSESEILAALEKLTGEISQTPSAYSAIKIDGREAYKRVRAGEKVEMPTRQVTVYSNQLTEYTYPFVKLRLKVSSGTYIRSVAQDLGELLGTGAYLSELVRTEVGQYHLSDAIALGGAVKAGIEASLIQV